MLECVTCHISGTSHIRDVTVCVRKRSFRYVIWLNVGDAVLGKLAVDGLSADVQKSGRFGLIAVCLFKGQSNILDIRGKISFKRGESGFR